MNPKQIYRILNDMFPHAKCELNYRNLYELTVAVLLSAQTTDVSVNKVTVALFKRYSTMEALAEAELSDLEQLIKSIGIYRNKAKNLKKLAERSIAEFDGEIPKEREMLMKLPGIGRKSANVILSEWFEVPAIAVDTHVERVAKRLALANPKDDVRVVEDKLMASFDEEQWRKIHQLMVFFGRYRCRAKNPNCEDCPFINICEYKKNQAV